MEPESSTAVSPEVRKWFNVVDADHSGRINVKELQAALVNSQGRAFSEKACALMIGLFDSDKSGTIDVTQFASLFVYISQWASVFKLYDRDSSGHIEEEELFQALQKMGYRLSKGFVRVLFENSTYRKSHRMPFDEFVVICIKIQRLTNDFRLKDINVQGVITIGFEEFLEVVLKDYL